VRLLRAATASTVDSAIRPLELQIGKNVSEVRERVDGIRRGASEEIVRVHRQISADAERAAVMAHDRVADVHGRAIQDLRQALEACHAAVTIARERADAVHPRTVLAAGYAILRDLGGRPLTSIGAVRKADLIRAELRDGTTKLLNPGGEERE
jgi:exodeoxyribonuclease VII large subunit